MFVILMIMIKLMRTKISNLYFISLVFLLTLYSLPFFYLLRSASTDINLYQWTSTMVNWEGQLRKLRRSNDITQLT